MLLVYIIVVTQLLETFWPEVEEAHTNSANHFLSIAKMSTVT